MNIYIYIYLYVSIRFEIKVIKLNLITSSMAGFFDIYNSSQTRFAATAIKLCPCFAVCSSTSAV